MTAFMYATPSGMQSLARMPEKLWRRSARWTESAIRAEKRSTIAVTESRKIPDRRPQPVPRGRRAGHPMAGRDLGGERDDHGASRRRDGRRIRDQAHRDGVAGQEQTIRPRVEHHGDREALL